MIRPEPALTNKSLLTNTARLEVVPQEPQFAPDSEQTSGYDDHVPVRPTRSMALSNAMKHSDLQSIAALDPLTNCYNRRFGLTRLREEFMRAKRSEPPLGLVMFDIDHFKLVNDSLGHLIGDRVLANVAKEAKLHLREGDVLIRYGGEDFLCRLPGASIEGAAEVCERMRGAIEAMTVQDRSQTIRCTVSLGFGSFPATPAEDEIALIGVVDEARYRAKNDGRNRTVKAA